MSTRLELILDRFVPLDGDRAIDLANGDLVCLRIRARLGDADERRRASAAALISTLRIPGMAPLMDYGIDGRRAWVEAYRLGPLDGCAGGEEERPLPCRTIIALLEGAGCGATETARYRGADGDPPGLFLPVPLERVVMIGDGWPAGNERVAFRESPAAGTVLERRDELDAVMEWMTGPLHAGARTVRIEAPPRAGMRTFFDAMAREARLAGFIPVSSRLCGPTALEAAHVESFGSQRGAS